jgi:hypothetical protein
MIRIFDLNPVRRAASGVPALAMLRHQSLKPYLASLAEQVWTDLALLEIARTLNMSANRGRSEVVGLGQNDAIDLRLPQWAHSPTDDTRREDLIRR